MNETEDKIWLASYLANLSQGVAAKVAANLANGAVQVYRERVVQDGDMFDTLQAEIDTQRRNIERLNTSLNTWRELGGELNTKYEHLRELLKRARPLLDEDITGTDLYRAIDDALYEPESKT